MNRFGWLVAALALLVGGAGQTMAGTVNVSNSDSGWYDDTGFHDSTNKNYISGFAGAPDHHDYFVFDLSGITGNVTGAQLQLFNPGDPNDGYNGPSGSSITYSVFDVSTSISNLESDNIGATGIFNDLGSGTSYGSVSVSAASNGTTVTITFNSAGLSAIQSAEGGSFAVGGALASPGTEQFIFGFSHFDADNRLVITTNPFATPTTTPEPASLTLLGLGSFCVLGYAWRGRKQGAAAN
jgi:hypothetical protein